MGSRKRPQTGLSICELRCCRCPHGRSERQRRGRGCLRSCTRSGQRHGRAPENASHLTTAFASGLSDSEAGTESRASTVNCAERGLSPAAAGLSWASIVWILGALVAGHSHRPLQHTQACSDPEWPYVLQAGCKDLPAKQAAAARADCLVTNHADMMLLLEQSLTGRCPQIAVTRERCCCERSTAALAASWLHWLARSKLASRCQSSQVGALAPDYWFSSLFSIILNHSDYALRNN